MRMSLVVSGLLYFVAVLQMKACNGCIERERIGLLQIKAFFVALGGEYAEGQLDSWVEDRGSNCCDWGIGCSTTGHVTDLALGGLTYGLPEYEKHGLMFNVSLLRPFEELVNLDLSSNNFEGWINDEEFPRLKKLETLTLLDNSLTSNILPSFSGLTSLRNLYLYGNSMNGSAQGLCAMKSLVELDFSDNMFTGQVPECLGILTNLSYLDLSNNLFTGNFPSFTSNLTSLTFLSLFGNYFQGSFSLSTLANHSKLEYLYISSHSPGAQVETENTPWFPTFQLKYLVIKSCNLNKDQGRAMPSFLRNQHDLLFIDLSHNKMVGEFPLWLIHNSGISALDLKNNSFVGKLQLSSILPSMGSLDISNNNLSGLLPKDIGILLPSINYLNLSINNFEGNIPASIGEMEELVVLDLSQNHFSGELHEHLATNWTNIGFLKLSNNLLQGNIPAFSNCNSLKQLYLNNNKFNGTLQEVLPNSPYMLVLDISNNSVSGAIPSSIGQLPCMKIILMAENQLEGEIPFGFSNMTQLEMLDLSQNKLSGSIPNFNISSLKFLCLQKNTLSGSIPFILSKSSKLIVLDLRDNKFSGYIPYWMDKLSQLRVLSLGGNDLEGQIPIQLCKLKNVSIMDLSRSNINGSIPSCFKNLSFGMLEGDDHFSTSEISMFDVIINLDKNRYDKFYPMGRDQNVMDKVLPTVEFRTKSNNYSYKGNILEIMAGLDLSCNKLTGTIPSQIGNLQRIKSLNLSHNYLSGSIPKTLFNLSQIESLDLSYNNLSGEIPYELTQLNFLSTFIVSYNNLSGIPPNINTGQFATFGEDSYKGNPGLCGPPLKHKCGSVAASPPLESTNTEEKETTVDMEAFRWTFIASYITILFGFITVLWINAYWRMALFHFFGKILCRFFPSFPLY